VPLPDAVGVTVPQNWDGMTDNAKIAEAARLTADNHNRRIVYVKKAMCQPRHGALQINGNSGADC